MSGPRRLVRKDGSASASSGSSGHEAGCACTRCRGFAAGNAVAVRHGQNSLRRTERSRELTDLIRQQAVALDVYGDAFETAYSLVGIALEKVERWDSYASEMFDTGNVERALSAERYAGQWWSRALRGLAECGLTSAAFARIARDASLSRAVSAQRDLDAYLARGHAGRVEP